MFGFNYKYSSADYKEKMQKAFENSTYTINYFVKYSIEGSEMAEQLEQRLLHTQSEAGNLIGYFDHNKQGIINDLTKFIKIIKDAILVFKYKINENAFRQQWHNKAEDLMKTLDSLAQWDIRNLIYRQISLIESLIKSCLKKDEKAQVHYYNSLLNNNRILSSEIASGIIRQYIDKFA
jgi:hypothetical protein